MFFCFNNTATTEIYTLSLHDALPISSVAMNADGNFVVTWTQWGEGDDNGFGVSARLYDAHGQPRGGAFGVNTTTRGVQDRKSTRLNSSHANISYAVFWLKKKPTQSEK